MAWMAVARVTARIVWGLALAVPGLCLVAGVEARGDRIHLRGGGEIRGKVLTDPERPEVVRVQTMNASSPLEFPRDAIARVVEEPGPLDEYFARRDQVPETAADHHEFGLWCEQNRLTGLAIVHYQRAVELDKDFGPAQKKLGRVEYDGRWMTYDERREAQGLVRHAGRWIAPEELGRIEARRADRAEHESWVRQIRVLRQGLASGTSAEREEAARRLAAIGEPAAIPALAEVLGGDSDPAVRDLLIRLLAPIRGTEATEGLVGRVLAEDDEVILATAIGTLSGRGDPDAARMLIGALDSKDPKRVGRAARALAALGAVDAVPRLVASLTRVERQVVLTRTLEPTGATGQGSAAFITGRSVPILTGPVVGPGVVAWGGTSYPYAAGTVLGAGPSGGATPGPPRFRVLTRVHRNPDVLAALESLTGRNLGYDTAAWKRWVSNPARDRPEPARRVPQP